MQLSIDKFGRVLLPKSIRDELGLVPGTPLKIKRTISGVALEPIQEKPVVVEKDGVLVFTGKAVGDLNLALKNSREARLAHFLAMEATE